MNRRLFASLALAVALLLCRGVARAQQAPEAAPPPPPSDVFFISMGQGPDADFGPLGGPEPIELLGFEGMHSGKVVTGAPFSAVATSESVQTLADGSHITRKTQTNLFRDGQGRFRKETTVQGFGPLAASGQPRTFIILHDAVAGSAFVLEPDKKIARQLSNPRAHDHGDGAAKGNLRYKLYKKFGDTDSNVQTEDLGKQTMNGINVQGTRRTRTIPAGQIGNEKALTVVFERWYSPDLQMVVMSKHTDPRFGQTTYNLTNIQQKEPDASLFAVPADYTVKQGDPGLGMGGHGARRRMNDAPQAPPAS
jgi:hypothetical protein